MEAASQSRRANSVEGPGVSADAAGLTGWWDDARDGNIFHQEDGMARHEDELIQGLC